MRGTTISQGLRAIFMSEYERDHLWVHVGLFVCLFVCLFVFPLESIGVFFRFKAHASE